MATALLTHPASLQHHNPAGHPERPERIEALLAALAAPAFAGLRRETAPAATVQQLLRAHSRQHFAAIQAAIPATGITRLDADTSVSPGSFEAALRAAGAVVRAVEMVLEGSAHNAFCALRPPGHHAERDRAMGFCLFNNIAIGALHAIEAHGLERVAVVDFDVHHGNGTAAIFAGDPRVLFASTHQMPLYPGTGSPEETGVGNLLHVPLAPFAGGEAFRAAITSRVVPALDSFRPELLLLSAGFDAHAEDPLAQLMLQHEDYVWVTRVLCAWAARHAGGRVVSVLEGGYSLAVLADSGAAHVAALLAAAAAPQELPEGTER